MLKFKITKSNIGVDSHTLEVTGKEITDANTFGDEEYRNINIEAKDIYGIQDGSELMGYNQIVVADADGGEPTIYDYTEGLVAEGVSKEDNSFNVKINKNLELDVKNVGIETRYNLIEFVDYNWEIRSVSSDFLVRNGIYGDAEAFIDINDAACGLNDKEIKFDDDFYDEYSVFYYENNEWKRLSLIDKDDMEGCYTTKDGYKMIDFYSFHNYDVIKDVQDNYEVIKDVQDEGKIIDNHHRRNYRKLDKNKRYYTKETYYFFDCEPTHYFTAPKENQVVSEGEDYEIPLITNYGKPIIGYVDYPMVIFSIDRVDEEGENVREEIEIECRREDARRLSFNYDKLIEEYPWLEDIFVELVFRGRLRIEDINIKITQSYQYNIDRYKVDTIIDTTSNTFKKDSTDYNAVYIDAKDVITLDINVVKSSLVAFITNENIDDIDDGDRVTYVDGTMPIWDFTIGKNSVKIPEGTKYIYVVVSYGSGQSLVKNIDVTIKRELVDGGKKDEEKGVVIYKDIIYQTGNEGVFNVSRDNLMYNDEYTTSSFIYDGSMNVIHIPFVQNFETDMYHNDVLKTHFVEVEKEKAVNPIMDLEKDVYTPAIHKGETNEDGEYTHINAEYDDCYKMIFNLHFREHRDKGDEKWVCERDSYWNGTRVLTLENLGNILDLQGRIYQYGSKTNKEDKHDYFSYFGVNPGENDSGNDKDDDYALDSNYNIKRETRNKLKEYQSDNLSFLGFTNDDVKYQKSKLKKSFLRLSFYDSDIMGRQNLLHTATIFLDSGNLFGKYVKNFETERQYEVSEEINYNGVTYGSGEIIGENIYNHLGTDKTKCQIYGTPSAVIAMDKDKFTAYDNNGARVNREPMRANATPINDSIGDFEQLRLSSQIEVTDKFSSNKSSEGFYFYTYRNNDNGVFPSNIYMRVDFNHAGFGRSIPFMMPYIRKNEEQKTRYVNRTKKIKTFDDICYDWSEIDYEKADWSKTDYEKADWSKTDYEEAVLEKDAIRDEEEIGYSTVGYVKYSYIKWKYRYDKDTQKHIYYLDPDVYGESVTSRNGHGNNIILNLYEGKIR